MKPHIQPHHDRSTRSILKRMDQPKAPRKVVVKHDCASVHTNSGVFAQHEAHGAVADYVATNGAY
jgi:hypothetical protein